MVFMRKLVPEKKPVRWTDWLVIVIGTILVIRTGENVVRLIRTGEQVTAAEARLEGLKMENLQLKGELNEARSPEFIEKEARDKLGYGREGELMVLLPPTPTPTVTPQPENSLSDLPNWQKWKKLYLKF